MGKEKKKVEILKVDLNFNLEEEFQREEKAVMEEVHSILEEYKKNEKENKDIIDELIDKLKEDSMTRDEISEMTGASGSKLSGVTTKLKKRLEKCKLELLIEGKKKNKTYKIKRIGDERTD